MRVKVNDVWYGDSEKDLIMVELDEFDKKNIAQMHPTCTKYCCYDDKVYTTKQIEEFMELERPKSIEEGTALDE